MNLICGRHPDRSRLAGGSLLRLAGQHRFPEGCTAMRSTVEVGDALLRKIWHSKSACAHFDDVRDVPSEHDAAPSGCPQRGSNSRPRSTSFVITPLSSRGHCFHSLTCTCRRDVWSFPRYLLAARRCVSTGYIPAIHVKMWTFARNRPACPDLLANDYTMPFRRPNRVGGR